MQPLYDDFLEDAFHRALLRLKDAVASQHGGAAVEMIATWAGLKASTIYKWLEQTNTPASWVPVVRLAICSSREGYTEFIAWMVASTYRLAVLGEIITNGSLADEKKRSDIVWGRIWDASDSANGAAVMALSCELHEIADSVHEEGARMQGTGPDHIRRAV